MVVGTLAADGWAVTFGTARRKLGGLRPAQSPPRCTKCNSCFIDISGTFREVLSAISCPNLPIILWNFIRNFLSITQTRKPTSSVTAGFGRHGMPPPATSDDTDTAFGQDGSDWSRDLGCHLDLWPWRSWCLWLMRVVVLHPCTKFEVCRPCHSEDMAHDVYQHLRAWWPWPLTFVGFAKLGIAALAPRPSILLQNRFLVWCQSI